MPEIKPTLIEWETTLEPVPGQESLKLTGHHYFGLGMRFVELMDKEGEFFTSDDKESETVRGSEKLTPGRWCAFHSTAGGKPVTVAVFDHPQNPRHPNKFFTMRPFAYMGATLNLWKEPMIVKTGESLSLRYGVAVWDGRVEKAEIEKVYRQWLPGENRKTYFKLAIANFKLQNGQRQKKMANVRSKGIPSCSICNLQLHNLQYNLNKDTIQEHLSCVNFQMLPRADKRHPAAIL